MVDARIGHQVEARKAEEARVTAFVLPRVKLDPIERSRAIGRVVESLEELPHDKTWRVEVEQQKSKRSDDQNAYYWGVVVETISQTAGYEAAEVHEFLCGTRWGWKDKRVPKTPRNPEGVESVPMRTTTTKDGKRAVLSVMEFADFIEFARRFAADKLSLYIPAPDPAYKIQRERNAA